jgi:hypothetical protein
MVAARALVVVHGIPCTRRTKQIRVAVVARRAGRNRHRGLVSIYPDAGNASDGRAAKAAAEEA